MTDNRNSLLIQTMFNRVSPRYDLLNRIISCGRDISWRKHAVELLGNLRDKTALDLCCGSGDFLEIFRRKYGGGIRLYGVDFAEKMLEIALKRFNKKSEMKLVLCRADALSVPFIDSSIDAVTIGFGIRNIRDRRAALKEITRILKPGGKLVMIEPAWPLNRFIRAFFSVYFRYISPFIGGIISGDRAAYKYLHDSFAAFPSADEFKSLMRDVGLANIKAVPRTFGTAMIYYGDKA